MIGIGERAGSGIPDIYQIWKNEGWAMPVVEEKYNPDRTCLTLTFAKKQAIKTRPEKQDAIREYLQQNGSSKTSAITEYIGLSPARTRNILVNMKDVVAEGVNKNRKYHLFDESGLVRK